MTKPHDDLHAAFVLHTRMYKDTSLLVELFSKEHGLFSAVARGVRKINSPTKGLLQPFTPIWMNYFGRNELVTLKTIEPRGLFYPLSGKNLFSALYLNELLLKVLTKHDPHPNLFMSYESTLQALIHTEKLEITLRRFEMQLLTELGYELILDKEAETHTPVEAELYYGFHPERGLIRAIEQNVEREHLFAGTELIAMMNEQWHEPKVLQTAKRLLRLALVIVLGNKPLKTRLLFS